MPRSYKLSESDQVIVLSDSVLDLFSAYRQKGDQPEAGGMLFVRFEFPDIIVEEASPPGKGDKRWRTLFIPCRKIQRRYIKQKYEEGLHFIGEWHTHPQNTPTPSSLDLRSMEDSFVKSQHELNRFIMIVVGNSQEELKLWVGVHNSTGYLQLHEIE
jgi:integrative and conjugative element protein (TIGR02256 family)